jgi:hypothetical protein
MLRNIGIVDERAVATTDMPATGSLPNHQQQNKNIRVAQWGLLSAGFYQ